jgi:hypothetical protein
MKFELHEPDGLMWPGKYGLVALSGPHKAIGVSSWETFVENSPQFVMVPSGRKNERPTCIFSSMHDLGRVELVSRNTSSPPPASANSAKATN